MAAAKAKSNKSFRGDQCNVNWASAESVIPYNRDTALPVLHLILGLVSAIKELMHAMPKNPSSLSPELAARLSARAMSSSRRRRQPQVPFVASWT